MSADTFFKSSIVLMCLCIVAMIGSCVHNIVVVDKIPPNYKFYPMGEFQRTENYDRSKGCDKVDVITTTNVIRRECYDEWIDVSVGSKVYQYVDSNAYEKEWGYRNEKRMLPQYSCFWWMRWCWDN